MLTKQYLEKGGVNVPIGKSFDSINTEDELLNYAKEIGYPVVLKPIDGKRGQGVFSNIRNEEELRGYIKTIRHDLGYDKVIIEKHYTGEEYRVYVVNNMVAGVIQRFPANITGDGKHTIEELINFKNEVRKKVPNLHTRLIKLDEEVLRHVKTAGYEIKSIPENGKQLILRQKGNLSTGGDSLDYTEEISQTVKNIALATSKAIPDLPQCGVDVLYDKVKDEAVVIEVNSRAGVGGHLFPLSGKARDIPK